MTKPGNVHELVREALDAVRPSFPDRIANLEHRGEGDGEWDGESLVAALTAAFRAAFAALAEDESLWVRSSGVESADVFVDLRWPGAPLEASAYAALGDSISAWGGAVRHEESSGEHHVRLTIPRWPPAS